MRNKKDNETMNPIWVGLTSGNHIELDSKTVMLFSRIRVDIQLKLVVSKEGGKGHRNKSAPREDETRRDDRREIV